MTELNRHSTKVTLYQGDDAARIKELERAAYVAVEEARRGPRRMNDGGVLPLAEEHDAFVKEARERAVVVTLNDIGRRKWRKLTQAHPGRDDNDDDRLVGGHNADTFPDALLMHDAGDTNPDARPTVASIVSPEQTLDTPNKAEVEEFLDSLNHGDFSRLFNEAYLLNAGAGVDPKASLVSALTPRSDETPK